MTLATVAECTHAMNGKLLQTYKRLIHIHRLRLGFRAPSNKEHEHVSALSSDFESFFSGGKITNEEAAKLKKRKPSPQILQSATRVQE